jgi:predicted Zn-dependent peptidase
MNVRKMEMKNGLVVTTEAMPHLRSVSLGVWVSAGSRFESEESCGISHFVEHMLFKGTRSRSAAELARIIDSVGGQLDAFTDKEYVGFYARVLDEHLPLAFELLSDIVLRPAFPAVEMERERNVILEEISMVEDSPQDLIQEIYLEAFWKGHSLGRPIAGSRESVAGIRRNDLMRHFQSNYSAANTIVSIAGNFAHKQVQELAVRYFSDMNTGSRADPGAPPTATSTRVVRHKPKLEQTHICLGTVCPPLLSEDKYRIHVLCQILGGGISSRLFQNIREKRGLVYSISSGLSQYRDAGTLVVYAGTAPRTARQVLELTVKELRKLRDRLVSSDELKRAKKSIKGSIMLSLESSSSRMTHMAQQQIYYGRIYSLEEIMAGIDRVTARDVRRMAAEIFTSSQMTLAALDGRSGSGLEEIAL